MIARRGRLDPVVARARSAVRDLLATAPPRPVQVALSGGADSLALLAVTAFVADRSGTPVRAVIVDHGLQTGSDQVAETAAGQSARLGVDASIVRVEVDPTGAGPEAAARDARYAALHRAAEVDDARILLAHTLDDQAECVLLGLGRGSGPRSLAGMRPVSGRLLRPLLGLRRADTEQVCRAHGLRWWDDPHNLDPRLRRVRVRHELLPLMEQVLGGGVAEALARTASLSAEDADLLDRLAAERATDETDALAELPRALRTRVLRAAAVDAGADGGELSAAHVAEMERMVVDWHGQKRVELPGGVSAVRDRNRLRFVPTVVAG